MAAIAAGKHVYCEKPLSVSLAEAEKMAVAAAAGTGWPQEVNGFSTPHKVQLSQRAQKARALLGQIHPSALLQHLPDTPHRASCCA